MFIYRGKVCKLQTTQFLFNENNSVKKIYKNFSLYISRLLVFVVKYFLNVCLTLTILVFS